MSDEIIKWLKSNKAAVTIIGILVIIVAWQLWHPQANDTRRLNGRISDIEDRLSKVERKTNDLESNVLETSDRLDGTQRKVNSLQEAIQIMNGLLR